MRDAYLKNMGIQTWQARVLLPGAKLSSKISHIKLLRQEKHIADLLLIGSNKQEEASNLLVAMLAAIELVQGEETCVTSISQCGQIIKKPLLVLGETTFSFSFHTPFVVTYHPAQLLQDKSLKAKAWNELKKFRSLLVS